MTQSEVIKIFGERMKDVQDEDKRWQLALKIATLFNQYIDNQ